ncbi:EAL domain-containing protein [Methylobacillus gramineus]|uniref:EAL domain-containing protein n=1 Tax=Methylobacillus gramineus TaxID=755169 RepID=UPI001CFF5C88|nr:EAL domain-containing protein [Methylobacillus gramineus]MCB5184197.1 EAL domain-containing protein [Methylobacillus gramineus]
MRILIVEDNPTDAELALRELTRSGLKYDAIRVETQPDYREALSSFSPSIILSDYSLPHFDGKTALNIAQEQVPCTPFLFLTGTIGEEKAIDLLKLGATDYILKSNLPRLPSAIRNALERAEEKAALRRVEQDLLIRNHAIEASAVPVMIADITLPGMPLIYVNKAFERHTGYSAEEALGRNCSFLQGEDTAQPELEKIRIALKERSAAQATLRNYRKDGSLFLNELHITPVRDNKGGVQYFVGVQNDITQIRQYQEALEHQANYDALTGLVNRNLLKERIKQAFSEARRQSSIFTVAFVDIDNFKRVNDSLGHSAGDDLIRMVGQRLQRCVRDEDTVARVGGDEFVLVLKDQSMEVSLLIIMQRIQTEMLHPFLINDKQLTVTCSIGLASFPRDGIDAETLLANADSAMYQAKTTGRNNFQFYAKEMNSELEAELALEHDLWHALENEEFVLNYQPQIELSTGKIIGVEALIRWQHPTRGLIPPNQFIPMAEEDGLIVPIGKWVLETACRDSLRLQAEGIPPIRIAVNLSARQLGQPDFVDQLEDVLTTTGINAECLELEITESMIMHNVETNIEVLRKISAAGIQLSLDDFGTGYSSLAYLQQFPINRLKIDQSFIRNIATDNSYALISRAIIGLAHSLEIQVIAEGIETIEQLDFVKSNHCNEGQGYFFSKPLEFEFLRSLLRSSKLVKPCNALS